jgi:hypothetical protein
MFPLAIMVPLDVKFEDRDIDVPENAPVIAHPVSRQAPDDALKVQVVPEHEPAPLEKLNVNAPVALLMLATPAELPPGLTYTPPTQANMPPVVVLCTRELGTEHEVPAGLPVNRLICGMRCAQTGIAKNSEM